MTEPDADTRHNLAMLKLRAERRELMREKREGKGLLMVHTGDGKGKSTAAFGMALRALGWGFKIGVVQFIKGDWATGEQKAFALFPEQVRFEVMGEGFTWDTADRSRDMVKARAAWETSLEMIADPDIDLVILDELNIALRYDYLPAAEIVAAIKARPEHKHVCVTGRNAPPELLQAADLVTEFQAVRHPFDQGFKAQKGIDF